MKRVSSLRQRIGVITAAILALAMTGFAAIRHNDWPAYGHSPGGDRFSPLKQIDTKNVNNLHVAWVYDTGEKGSFFETTPIVVGNRMYFTTPQEHVVALSATTGKKIWSFDPHVQRAFHQRGVSYWPGDAHHAPRIILATTEGNMYALDAKTGKLVPTFGDNGIVDLKAGVATTADPHPRLGITSPPAIYKNLIILGPETQEGPSYGPTGDPRAFSAITGKQVWRFHTVPQPGEANFGTWGGKWKNRAGPSAWGFITVDAKRGLVFIPVGNPAGNMYGADRKGKNLYSASVICLRASTGKLIWYFQLVHHDLWDYDVSAAPALITVHHNGQSIPAVVAIGKDSLMYILNERTGKPVYGVEERPVPKSDVPGEQSWPTQPFPLKPPPLARMSINAKELNQLTPDSAKYCAEVFSKYQNDGPFTPYGTKPTVVFPGTIGGANWNGVSYNPQLGYIFANISNIGALGQMVPNKPSGAGAGGRGGRGFSQSAGMAYRNNTAYARFRDQNHYPCNAPPWGQLVAVNANTGNIAWKSVLGEYPAFKAVGIPNTGTPNLGGSIATAGGLVFIGATADHHFRAFDARTGKQLWSIKLDGYVNATPITYRGSNGKQYVAVSDGPVDSFLGTFLPQTEPVQAKIVAFALPPIPHIPGSAASIASVLATPAGNTSARPQVELPAGPARDLVMNTCSSCHGISTVVSQRRSGQQWVGVIRQMVHQGAHATDQQFAEIERYLTAHYGKPLNVNQASAKDLEDAILLSQHDAEAIVKYRAAHGPFKSLSDIQNVPGINTAQIKAQEANIEF